jgi:hypothetical protein
MKAQDLRIKNLAQDKLTGELLICCVISDSAVSFSVLDRSKYPLPDGWEAEPIPLTEEWLVKFGFDHNPTNPIYMKLPIYRGFSWISVSLKDNLGEIAFDRYCAAQPPLKHVHQLQNLFFALTGQELTLNETA